MRMGLGTPVDLKVVDNILHDERTGVTWTTPLRTLPDGTMVQVAPEEPPCLWWHGRLLQWSFDGYDPRPTLQLDENVAVLTPRSLVEVLKAGYPISVHPSVAA
ncbi:MAG: hypothetical protein ABW168_27685 [Sedimenticola sp.]